MKNNLDDGPYRARLRSYCDLLVKNRQWDIEGYRVSFNVIARSDLAIPLSRLTPATEGFPWDDLRKILHGGQRMARVQNGDEILPKVSTP